MGKPTVSFAKRQTYHHRIVIYEAYLKSHAGRAKDLALISGLGLSHRSRRKDCIPSAKSFTSKRSHSRSVMGQQTPHAR